ncbi:N6-adenosine-methyltransferase subunit METTL3 [Galdieria sulphuraria]|uniref:mRNA (2'-O-methyladenosine-N6-)-methyltransferase n=1 Tax=Galdieria sulphuraria TaxID=130081 RepID=M2XAM7_GALSU|nr:mRNA (2'-O-methyladenosine-N6-)-methyltransferase [Galdieria sulphuraria]EME26927.1 mRNA (2'-O-methyladenosine-N6-)-methyltransferase [Galdieria sulphuraria]GJD10606.1 N6-adenosine-methyltransferase subunit METTL3 [Galdieria sulphuraria]|eukprot:XP_005703447.1 mRNA (2'-O-methyladenosine-N6-)-methyltransferase [Galdieria sulphuraria]
MGKVKRGEDADFELALSIHREENSRDTRFRSREAKNVSSPGSGSLLEQSWSSGTLKGQYVEDDIDLSALQNVVIYHREKEFFSFLDTANETAVDQRFRDGAYINCDLRYFNLRYLREKLGSFDVVLADPPWRIRGAEKKCSSDGIMNTMFSNSRWQLEYRTLSFQDIRDMDIGCLSDEGFLFLWVVKSQVAAGLECLGKWGYDYVDLITWVKTRNRKLHISHGYHILHSTELCLVGLKSGPNTRFRYVGKVANDVIISSVRERSRKPDQLYHIIEAMFPGSQKIELFARNHNIRPGWLSLGNELGENYVYWHNEFTCDRCQRRITTGRRRYKSRIKANYDICEICWPAYLSEHAQDGIASQEAHFFALENVVEEAVYHEYFECNMCKVTPIWGVRFSCQNCEEYDLCEACFDKSLLHEEGKKHSLLHTWKAYELPQSAGDLPVHRGARCQGCLQYPIIGYRFHCLECVPTVDLCQKCFFAMKLPRSHTFQHEMEAIITPSASEFRRHTACAGCKMKPIGGNYWKCDSCFSFELCDECYQNKVVTWSYPGHKAHHSFSMVIQQEGNSAAALQLKESPLLEQETTSPVVTPTSSNWINTPTNE